MASKSNKGEILAKFFDDGEYTALFADGAVSAACGYAAGQQAYAVYQNGEAVSVKDVEKNIKVLEMAAQTGCPVVTFYNSVGAKLAEGLDVLTASAKLNATIAKVSGVIPQIAVVTGVCGGTSALSAANADVCVMAEDAELFFTAPFTSAAKGDKVPGAGTAEAAAKAASAPKEEVKELSFDELLATKVPKIEVVDMGVHYAGHNPESPTFVTIGERIHCISPAIRKAMDERDPAPILKRAAEQIAAGATYLDVNIGPAEKDGPERMMWAVKLLQENFDNVPLALDTANKKAIEAGIKVYNRTNGKPIVNSADAGSRISNIDLAAANDAICIALCSADGIAKDNEERMMHCRNMLERGLSHGMEATDLWFDPLFLVVKGMQDKQMDVLNAIKLFADEGLKSTGGLSNNSNGAPKKVRPIMDSALVAMAMMQGLTSAIVNPCDLRLMETIKSCDIFKNHMLYSDSYLGDRPDLL